MTYLKDITIAITSCWRFKLLKKMIESIEQNIDLSDYPKIITEDSKDEDHIAKMQKVNDEWFLKWWKIIYTKWSWQADVLKCHYFALKALYENISTKYTFHCEDDQLFYKTDYDFIKLSYDILESKKDIAIVTLRDLYKDYWIKKKWLMKTRYYDILTDKEEVLFWHKFIYWNPNSLFNLQPWLRRTDIVKKAMFWYEETINETLVSQRIYKQWFEWIYIEKWIYWNPDRRINSTRNIRTMWFKKYILDALWNAIRYRFRLFRNYLKHLLYY